MVFGFGLTSIQMVQSYELHRYKCQGVIARSSRYATFKGQISAKLSIVGRKVDLGEPRHFWDVYEREG